MMDKDLLSLGLWAGVFLLLLIGLSPDDSLASRGITIKTEQGQQVGRYTGSFALLVGVSRYKSRDWPDLHSVPGEIERVKNSLTKHGFKVKKVPNPDSQELKDAFEQFIYDYGYEKNNRLLFFYSGHGYSIKKGNKGFLVPADARSPKEDIKD